MGLVCIWEFQGKSIKVRMEKNSIEIDVSYLHAKRMKQLAIKLHSEILGQL